MTALERNVRFAVNREAPGSQLSLWLAQADGRPIAAVRAYART
jgi:hypothetical protein